MRTELRRIDLGKIDYLEVNARFMRHETYQRLVENIRKDGTLTSVPLVVPQDSGRYLVISGNHRVRAAIDAGVNEADVMAIVDPLTRQQQISIQLAHNSLTGEDDPTTLRQLYEQLEQIDWRLYSGLDDKSLDLLSDASLPSLTEANLAFQTVMLTFLPDELREAQATFAEVRGLYKPDAFWLARFQEYDDWLDALETVGDAYGISNVATTLAIMLRIVQRHYTELQEGWCTIDGSTRHTHWVPIASIFGATRIPQDSAHVILKAVDNMRDSGDVHQHSLWKAIELWAADYLAGR